ncbi:LiaF transmembrane domain-containing protein [Priestia koreensis]|uniref:LiaF transmembrane domain-containing protein n=1 Tax=Priestia koreensis TaxID=284581 RepID=UPI001F5ACF61|nr:DUF5668 domain-containing protein [Priestia koreensis]MCM3002677.1 DUF5668 domain-containing protein [Priestia koreensis]UNL84381.1 hypothetical protein IE339_19910 [Priestia koreensis]
MKKQSVFFGTLLVGFGLIFFAKEFHLAIGNALNSWPSLLIIIGIALLAQSQKTNDNTYTLTGSVLIILGAHFHAVHYLPFWPDQNAMVLLMIGIGFVASYRQIKIALFQGTVLIVVALIQMFWEKILTWSEVFKTQFTSFGKFWPLLLLVIGLYLLFFKKK